MLLVKPPNNVFLSKHFRMINVISSIYSTNLNTKRKVNLQLYVGTLNRRKISELSLYFGSKISDMFNDILSGKVLTADNDFFVEDKIYKVSLFVIKGQVVIRIWDISSLRMAAFGMDISNIVSDVTTTAYATDLKGTVVSVSQQWDKTAAEYESKDRESGRNRKAIYSYDLIGKNFSSFLIGFKAKKIFKSVLMISNFLGKLAREFWASDVSQSQCAVCEMLHVVYAKVQIKINGKSYIINDTLNITPVTDFQRRIFAAHSIDVLRYIRTSNFGIEMFFKNAGMFYNYLYHMPIFNDGASIYYQTLFEKTCFMDDSIDTYLIKILKKPLNRFYNLSKITNIIESLQYYYPEQQSLSKRISVAAAFTDTIIASMDINRSLLLSQTDDNDQGLTKILNITDESLLSLSHYENKQNQNIILDLYMSKNKSSQITTNEEINDIVSNPTIIDSAILSSTISDTKMRLFIDKIIETINMSEILISYTCQVSDLSLRSQGMIKPRSGVDTKKNRIHPIISNQPYEQSQFFGYGDQASVGLNNLWLRTEFHSPSQQVGSIHSQRNHLILDTIDVNTEISNGYISKIYNQEKPVFDFGCYQREKDTILNLTKIVEISTIQKNNNVIPIILKQKATDLSGVHNHRVQVKKLPIYHKIIGSVDKNAFFRGLSHFLNLFAIKFLDLSRAK